MSWITEHLTETDERVPASALYFENYLDSDPDTISDDEYREAMEYFDRAQDCEDDEDYYRGHDEDHRDPIEYSLYRGRL